MRRFWLTLCVIALSSGLAQQNMTVLYDPKIPPAALNLSATEQQKIVTEVTAFARATLKQACPDNLSAVVQSALLDAKMTGSFTKPGTQQTAYVVKLPCVPKNSDLTWSIAAIYEAKKPRSAFLFTSTELYGGIAESYAVRDINQNNLSEIAVTSRAGDGAGSATYLDLIEWRSVGPQPIGSLIVGSYDATDGRAPDVHEYTVYVAKGPKPVFVGLEAGSTTRLSLLPLEKPRVTVNLVR